MLGAASKALGARAAFGKMVSPIVAGTAFTPNFELERQSANVYFPFPLSFGPHLAGNILSSVRSDKAWRAETMALAVSPKNRSLCSCRPADLQLPSGRLKLACIPKWIIKVLVRLLRTANDARWRNKQQEGCARVPHTFRASPNRSFAFDPLNRGIVTVRCTRQRQEKSERETGKERRPFGFCTGLKIVYELACFLCYAM